MPHLRMCGFRTDEVRRKPGGRVGFDVVTLQGTHKPLARINEEVRSVLLVLIIIYFFFTAPF